MQMNKLKLFTENFLVYGLGGIISKIIPLVMVPVVTRLMPDSAYFGISDLSGTVVSFASSFAIMGMYDAMYRMFFERPDTEYRKTVCSTALLFTFGTSLIIFCVMLAAKDWIAQFFGDGYTGRGDKQYYFRADQNAEQAEGISGCQYRKPRPVLCGFHPAAFEGLLCDGPSACFRDFRADDGAGVWGVKPWMVFPGEL